MATYTPPRDRFYQVFTPSAEAVSDRANAFVVGPQFDLIRYSVTAEKSLGSLGVYDPTTEVTESWPTGITGARADLAFTKLFMDDAELKYFTKTGVTAPYYDSGASLVNTKRTNMVRFASPLTEANGQTLDAGLNNRPVTVGDIVRLSAVVTGTLHEHKSVVVGFNYEKTAAAVGTASEASANESAKFDSGESSSSTGNASVTAGGISYPYTATAAAPSNIEESPYTTGVGSDTYTLTCVTGGAYNSAVFNLVSASGTDNAYGIVLDGSAGVAEEIGSKGLEVTFTGTGSFVTGNYWTIAVSFSTEDTDITSGGTYTGSVDDTYIITVVRGGKFGSAVLPRVSVRTAKNYDSGGPYTVTNGTTLAIGNYGVTVSFSSPTDEGGLYLGDVFYVPVTAAAAGAARTLVLRDSIPAALLGSIGAPVSMSASVAFKKSIQLSNATDFSVSSSGITINAGITSSDPAVYSTGSGSLVDIDVVAGNLYVECRSLNVSNSLAISSVYDTSQVEDVLGAISPDNPLAYAVYKAALNSDGAPVYFVSVVTNDLSGYNTAYGLATSESEVYNLVPLSSDPEIEDATIAHVNASSSAEQHTWRKATLMFNVGDYVSIVDKNTSGATLTATIADDPDTGATDFVLVTATSVDFVTAGVTAGDVLRVNFVTDQYGNQTYQSFEIDEVVSSTILKLAAGPSAAVSTAAKIEVWRAATGASIVAAAQTGLDANRRIVRTWPDLAIDGNIEVSGIYVSAAVAGAGSAVVPWRSITNRTILGFSDLYTRSCKLLTATQLDQLSAAGITVVAQTSPSAPAVIRHYVTTDNSDIDTFEAVITSNIDNVCRNILASVTGYRGLNITTSLVNNVTTSVRAVESALLNRELETGYAQIEGFVNLVVARHPVLKDRLVISTTVLPAYPFNGADITVII